MRHILILCDKLITPEQSQKFSSFSGDPGKDYPAGYPDRFSGTSAHSLVAGLMFSVLFTFLLAEFFSAYPCRSRIVFVIRVDPPINILVFSIILHPVAL